MATALEPLPRPTTRRTITREEFHALPDDGVRRWVIRGVLYEENAEGGMTKRNRWHSRTETRVAHLLECWLGTQPEPRGQVVSGEAGFELGTGPYSGVGVDVAYVSPEVAAASPDEPYFPGPPVLAVEVLSPSTPAGDVRAKVAEYLKCGVAVVWVVDPTFQTVTVHRPNARVKAFDADGTLDGGPDLPGFRCAVSDLFR